MRLNNYLYTAQTSLSNCWEDAPTAYADIKKPRYVRVNTIKIDVPTVINYLLEEGWNLKENISYHDLGVYDFAIDDFIESLLVFKHGTELHNHPLYLDGSFILQDKASCLPPLALKPRSGRVILDACAAPGMKTSFLSALSKNEGTIIAIEKNAKRCSTLRAMLEGLGTSNVTVMNQDFTDINPREHPEVEYILVDPSCSGSGMYNRVEIHFGPNNQQRKERLKALSFYQRRLLVHAMKFPNVKRIVYSTCSINAEENEDVIAAALDWGDGYTKTGGDEEMSLPDQEQYHSKFKVKKALPAWPHRLENPNYEWAEFCVKSDYENDLTDGFFVAVLERVKDKSKSASDDMY